MQLRAIWDSKVNRVKVDFNKDYKDANHAERMEFLSHAMSYLLSMYHNEQEKDGGDDKPILN